MPFACALTAHLEQCPERVLSCWRKHPVVVAQLNAAERRVINALLQKAGIANAASFTLVVGDAGISVTALVPLDGGDLPTRRRARCVKPVANYNADTWSLYLRLLCLPPATREGARVPFLSPLPFLVNQRVQMLRRWTPGQTIRVYRSTRGFHAAHYLHEDRPPRGSFLLLLVGTVQADFRVRITSVNTNHPFAALVCRPHQVSRSDLNDLTFRPDVWP